MSDKNPDQPQQSAKAHISAPAPLKGQRTRRKAEDEKKVPPRANGGKSEKSVPAGKKAPAKKKAAPKAKRGNTSSQRGKAAKHPGGRPSPYNPKLHPKLAFNMALRGLTDEKMALELEITTSTFYLWKSKYPEFSEAVKNGKDGPDDAVENSLFQRATGYSHQAVKIFMPAGFSEPVYAPFVEHFPPDPTSMIFWLKNRRPAKWRDKVDVKVEDVTKRIDTSKLTDEQRDILAELAISQMNIGEITDATEPDENASEADTGSNE